MRQSLQAGDWINSMTEIQTGTTEEAKFVVEQDRRLSQSMLWRLQRDFFQQQGIEAWRQGIVPHYITSSPYLANAYARLVLGFLRDCRAAATMPQGADSISLDLSQPIYIIELGSGSGRFAYHFLKKFLGILTCSALRDIPVKLIMTDFAEPTISFWQSHSSLQPFVASGQLDFARFDAEHPQELTLLQSGQVLVPGAVKNPVVLLANYFFDSIPQDCFGIRDGQLGEGLLTIISSQPESDLGDPALLERIEIAYENRPVPPDYDYYDDPDLNQILRTYQQRLDNTFLVFPLVALRCIRFFRDLAGDRLLLLSADRGYSREESLLNRGEPDINLHGSISMMVNYHAIGQYICNQGGLVLQTTHHHASLNVAAFLLGRFPQDAIETRLAFMEAIEKSGPDDFFSLKKGVEENYETLTLQQLLALLRLSGWDSNIFLSCFPVLLDLVDSASGVWQQELYRAIERVWDDYYPIGEEKDLAFCMGMLLYCMGYYAEALSYFQRSLQLYGPDPNTFYNMAMCHYGLRQLDTALNFVNRVLDLDPTFEAARAIQADDTRFQAFAQHLTNQGKAASTVEHCIWVLGHLRGGLKEPTARCLHYRA
jgi:tetratricopeptide (TPR) repeat protein